MSSKNTALLGHQWGDEGKGKSVDNLAVRHDVVVRFQGGGNAGHTLIVDGKKIVLHLCPAGSLYDHVLNIIGPGVIFDPTAFAKELSELRAHGYDPNIMVSTECNVVMPYLRDLERMLEAALSGSIGQPIGTTGRAIGTTTAFRALRSVAITVGDLMDRDVLAPKIKLATEVANAMLVGLAQEYEQEFATYDPDTLIDELTTRALYDTLRPIVGNTTASLHQSLSEKKRILWEGANGTLLDPTYGVKPFVTSTPTTVGAIPIGAGVPASAVGTVIGLIKAYQTRVGNGGMPTELQDDVGKHLAERGDEYGATTGRPRRCGWLDLVAAAHALAVNGTDLITLTKLDVLTGLDEIKVCTGYTRNGASVKNFPTQDRDLVSMVPEYVTLPGWSEDISQCRKPSDLPANALHYIDFVKDWLQKPLYRIGVGADRNDFVAISTDEPDLYWS